MPKENWVKIVNTDWDTGKHNWEMILICLIDKMNQSEPTLGKRIYFSQSSWPNKHRISIQFSSTFNAIVFQSEYTKWMLISILLSVSNFKPISECSDQFTIGQSIEFDSKITTNFYPSCSPVSWKNALFIVYVRPESNMTTQIPVEMKHCMRLQSLLLPVCCMIISCLFGTKFVMNNKNTGGKKTKV